MTTETIPMDASILIIDDDQYIIRLIEAYLKAEGFTRIHSVTDPRDAIEEYQKHNPDLVLLDIFMPHVDGFAILQEIAAIHPYTHNVLILTFLDDNAILKKALDAGAKDILGKPFTREDALKKVKAALAGRAEFVQE